MILSNPVCDTFAMHVPKARYVLQVATRDWVYRPVRFE